jgi:hypothetical protein
MFSLFTPYRWLAYAAILAALVAGAWRVHHVVDKAGYDRAVAEYTAQALKADQAARVREQALQSQVTKAQNDAQIRQTALAADAARARAAADSLSSNLAALRARLPGLARDAVDRYAATATVVFEQCSRRYSGLAATADAIGSERQTLIDARPK